MKNHKIVLMRKEEVKRAQKTKINQTIMLI